MAIEPGATIGILGGGQLGRMTAMAARSLGYHIHALDPDPSCASRFVVEQHITADFDDEVAAAFLAKHCAVVTIEIEKIGIPALEAAARYAPTRPGAEVLRIIQDRGRQKAWLVANGFPVGSYVDAATAAELAVALDRLGDSFVKSCTGGYDGRGQLRARSAAQAETVFAELGAGAVVVEQALPLEAELSVLVARRPGGEVAVYPPALNRHEAQILEWSSLPAPLPARVTQEATEIGRAIAEKLRIEGLLVIELFLLAEGRLLVNELAPRPHNSFHSTEVACATSQFEQAVRAICDLPLGSVEVVRPAAIANLLGDLWEGERRPNFTAALAIPGVRLHLYGKRVARPGRKMGHLSATGATPEEAARRVLTAKEKLSAG